MSEHDAPPADAPEAAPIADPVAAGTLLTQAREAAGLTVDAVAQQLKLAPRQVRALESGDFGALPGRTFVRGFVRNYARLVRLDPAAALAALPDAVATPSLDRPALASGPRSIGEIPAQSGHKPGVARWAIPLALIAIVGVAVFYELGRPPAQTRRAEPARTAPASAPNPSPAASSALPNPLATAAESAAPPGTPAASPAAPRSEPVSVAPPAALPMGETTLEFGFRGQSWVEVRDGKGTTIMSTMGTRGATQAVTSTPPLDIVVGNASEVDVTFGGVRIDTRPYHRQNVARLRLPLPAAATK